MTTENLDKVIDRIRKLQGLATSQNVHEASAAAGEAQRLMTAHRISEASLADPDNQGVDETVTEIEVLADTGTKTPRSWIVQLANGIALANGCRITVMTATHNGPAGSIKMYGRKYDLDGARYLFMTMKNEIDRLSLAWKDSVDGRYGRSGIFSFKLGAAVEICARMREAKKEQETTLVAAASLAVSSREAPVMALAVLNRAEANVTAYVDKVSSGKVHKQSGPSSYGAYQAGKQAGSTVSIGGNNKSLGSSAKQIR